MHIMDEETEANFRTLSVVRLREAREEFEKGAEYAGQEWTDKMVADINAIIAEKNDVDA